MTTSYKGIAHGLGPKNGVSCDITPQGDGLAVESIGDAGFSKRTLPYLGLTVGFEGFEDRYIAFKGVHANTSFKLLVADRAIVPALTAIGAPRMLLDALQKAEHRRGGRKRNRMAIFAGLATLVVLLGLGIWLGFGIAVDKAVEHVPLSWEISVGQTAANEMLATKKVCSDPQLLAAVNEMGARLIGALPTIPFDFKIRVIDTDDVNAFALPGGYLFINRGLIDQADDGHEVAGVLAHEIQHAILRHGIRNVVREAGLALLLSAMVGDVNGIEQFLIYNAAHLSSMSFSRDQETAADLNGLDLMWRAKLDPTGLPRFLKKLADKEGSLGDVLSIIATHPASSDRIGELNALIQRKGQTTVIPFKLDVSQIKGRCDPVTLADPDAPL